MRQKIGELRDEVAVKRTAPNFHRRGRARLFGRYSQSDASLLIVTGSSQGGLQNCSIAFGAGSISRTEFSNLPKRRFFGTTK